jgi:hypothetical protein
MSEETTEQEVEQVESSAVESSADDRAERFAAAINGEERERDDAGRFTSTTEQPPADDASPQEESVAVDEPVSEGPSASVLAAAKAVLPEDIVEAATSDQELLFALQMAKRFQAAEQQPEPAAEQESAFAIEWPDDDVPQDDPYRMAIEKLANQFIERDRKREENLQAIAQWAMTKEQRERDTQEVKAQEQFDKLLDEAGIEGFGKSDKLVPGKSPEWQKRNASYAEFATLTTQLGYSPEQAIQAIALKAGKPVQQQQTPRPSLVKQSKSRLGGAPSRPAAAPPMSREERFAEAMSALN